MKKKERNGLLWLLLCIPIPIIIYLGIMYSQNEISHDDIKSVIVTDTTGLQGKYSEDRASIDFFVDLILNAEKVENAWRSFDGETPVELTFERNNGSVFRHYVYAELDVEGCFVIDKDGNVKRIASEDAKKMLSRPEWKYLYEPLLLPRLAVVKDGSAQSDARNVPPSEYSWKYKKTDGSFASDNDTKIITDSFKPVYINGSDYDFTFSTEPDVMKVVIRNGDMILEDNSLRSLIFAADTKLDVQIEAAWNQTEKSDFYGSGKWDFTIIYDILPTVTLEKREFEPGEIICAKFVNLSDGEDVALDTELRTSAVNPFSSDGCKLVYLPVTPDNRPGNYALKFSVGDSEFEFEISVKAKEYGTVKVTVDAEILNEAFKPDNKKALADLIANCTRNSSKGALYDGRDLVRPAESKSAGPVDDPALEEHPAITFGTSVIYNNSDPPYVTYRGTDIMTEEGGIVKSAQRGTVVYNGETAETGKTIIIDHGNGILSYYFHLSNAQTGEGRVVQKGEIIGNSGSTGLTDSAKLCFAVSVNGVFADPDYLFANGFPG